MPIKFSAAPSYFWLNTWVLANIIELATQNFCNQYVTYKIDPQHRLYDQMTQAARSIRANIAEGSGRHDTSFETEMRLTDVARGSAHELLGDYMNYMMSQSIRAWDVSDPRFQHVITIQLERPSYSENIIVDVMAHIIRQKAKLAAYLDGGSPADVANCLVALCLKINAMLTSMLDAQLRDFKRQGGFAENLTKVRLEARSEEAASSGAPQCPKCGKPMLKRTIQRVTRQGQQFWGCSDYPNCSGAKDIREQRP